MQALAFVEVATTGLLPDLHQVLELCVLRVDAHSLAVLVDHETLVAPEHLCGAQPEALQLCGYSQAAWENAPPLRDALLAARPLLEGALIAGHHVGFAWRFLEEGYRRCGLPMPRTVGAPLDTASLAWPLWAARRVPSLSLDSLARYFGLSRGVLAHARGGAHLALQIARRLLGQAAAPPRRRTADASPAALASMLEAEHTQNVTLVRTVRTAAASPRPGEPAGLGWESSASEVRP